MAKTEATMLTDTYVGIRVSSASPIDKADALLRTYAGEIADEVAQVIQTGQPVSPEFYPPNAGIEDMIPDFQISHAVDLLELIALARDELNIGRRDYARKVLHMIVDFTPLYMQAAHAEGLGQQDLDVERVMVRRNVAEHVLGAL